MKCIEPGGHSAGCAARRMNNSRVAFVILLTGRQKVGAVRDGRLSTPSVSPPILGEKRNVDAFISGFIRTHGRRGDAQSMRRCSVDAEMLSRREDAQSMRRCSVDAKMLSRCKDAQSTRRCSVDAKMFSRCGDAQSMQRCLVDVEMLSRCKDAQSTRRCSVGLKIEDRSEIPSPRLGRVRVGLT